jgi:hypothetical protein
LKIDANVHSKSSVADRDPRFGAFLTPGSGIQIWDEKKIESPDPGTGMNIPDQFFGAEPDPVPDLKPDSNPEPDPNIDPDL